MKLARGYAHVVTALWWLLIPASVVATVYVGMRFPATSRNGTAEFTAVVSAHDPALVAQERAMRDFDFPALARIAVVQRDPDGLSVKTQYDVVSTAAQVDANGGDSSGGSGGGVRGVIPIVNTFRLVPSSRESGTTAISYVFETSGTLREQVDRADAYARRLGGDVVGVTGAAPARAAQSKAITGALTLIELASLALVILVVGRTFRSAIAPIVPLAATVLAYELTVHLLPVASEHLGLVIPAETEPIVVVLLVGVMTDYSIFYLDALRRCLRDGASRHDAALEAIAGTTPIVIAAVITVASGTAALTVAQLPLFRNLGPGLALAVVAAGLVAVVFVPACCAGFARLLYWPGATADPDGGDRPARPLRRRIARTAVKRPVAAVIAVVGVAGLFAVGWPARGGHLGINLIEDLSASSRPALAASAAGSGFAPGIVAPTEIVVRGPSVASHRDALLRVQHWLEARRGVAGVLGPGHQPLPTDLGIVKARSGDAVRYLVVFGSSPYAAPAIENLQRIRHQLPGELRTAGLTNASGEFAGDTALAADIVATAHTDLFRIAAAILVIELLVLLIFLRSVVAAALVIFASLLVVLTALSITDLVFADLRSLHGLTFYVPFAVAVLLLSFGADYSVYVVGRIWARSGDLSLRDAIVEEGSNASSAISAAGVTLALTFALLGIVNLASFREFALAMAAGILIDTFVVRPFLVPALLALLGRWSAWPSSRWNAARADRPSG